MSHELFDLAEEPVDAHFAFRQIVNFLAGRLDFYPHKGEILYLEDRGVEDICRALLETQGISAEGAGEGIANVQSGGALTIYSHGMLRLEGQPVDYLVVLKNASAAHAVAPLGEEVTHGEHVCFHYIDLGQRTHGFHPMTSNF